MPHFIVFLNELNTDFEGEGISFSCQHRLSRREEIIARHAAGGLFIGVELVKNKDTKEPLASERMGAILTELLDQGVIAVPCGRYHNVIRYMPSLIITKEYLEKATDILLNICRKFSR